MKSIMVQTVNGPIEVSKLGVTLMHEHLLIDIPYSWHKPTEASKVALAKAPVNPEIIGELKYDPYINLDNIQMSDIYDATYEVMKFKELGGQTIIDATSRYNGRDPLALKAIAQRTGLNIVMGGGYFMEKSLPDKVKDMSIEDAKEKVIKEITIGVDGSGIKVGIIGEAGVGINMTDIEVKLLRAQSRAQAVTNVPLTIHTYGWGRPCHKIIDIVAEEGANLKMVILDHMNPSGGMDYYYPGEGQSPSDEENARAIKNLIDAGYINQILLSQDVFLKMMLTKYGGNGYGHILKHFLPRLKSLGVNDQQIYTLLVENPQRVFIGE